MTIAMPAEEQPEKRWYPGALLVALVYPVIGVTFAALDKLATSGPIRFWRLAAWLAAAAVFGVHLAFEHLRLRARPLRAALHVSLAVALGALLLAVWVNLHGLWVASTPQSPLAPWALIVFPLVTGLPAFVVAFAAMALLGRLHQRPR